MIDSFPLLDSDSDHSIQLLIGSDLTTADRLSTAFSRANPDFEAHIRERLANRRSALDLDMQRPGRDQLYPELTKTTYRREWLFPLVRRFMWNYSQGETNAPWCRQLVVMIDFTIFSVRDVNDAEFLQLAESAPALAAHGSQMYCSRLGSYFADREKRGPLTRELLVAARKLLVLCPENSSELKAFAWALFREEAGMADVDWGWSVRLHRDLSGLRKKDRTTWIRALDGDLIRAVSRRAAVARLGNTQIEQCLRRWIDWLRQDAEIELSPFGAVVFDYLIGLCEGLGGQACDELLYEIAKIKWKRIRAPNWVATYLTTLSRRPPDRAFACLEALMMNPVTADRFVRRQYEALASTFGARELPPAPVGVDGFLLGSDVNLQPHQARIDQLLRMGAAAADQGQWRPPGMRQEQAVNPSYFRLSPEAHAAIEAMETSILREFSSDLQRLHLAVTRRVDWILTHRQNYSADRLLVWWQIFAGLGCEGGLAQRSLGGVQVMTLEHLLATFRSGAGEQILEQCQKYIDANGWCPELVAALQKYIPTIGNALSDQVRRARAEWFLWFEDVCPIQTDACWSHRVKRDLREMTAEERAAWRALLENNSFRYSGKPAQSWLTAAGELFPTMDRDTFQRRFVAWFEPFSKAEPLRLTVTGRNILRVLMWYALIAENSKVDEALAQFAKVKWKTKDSAAKASQAEMAFSYVLSRRAPERALLILEQYVSTGRAFEGSETHRIYEELCRQQNRTPIPALPEKSAVKDRPSPTLQQQVRDPLPTPEKSRA